MSNDEFVKLVGSLSLRYVGSGVPTAAVDLEATRDHTAAAIRKAATAAEKAGLFFTIRRDGKGTPRRGWLTSAGINRFAELPKGGRR